MSSPVQASRSWSTRDIVVTAALAVAIGISFIVFDWVYVIFQSLLGSIAQSILEGLWLLGALVVPYIVRRPGSALLGEVIAAVVEASFNPFGVVVILGGLLEGAGAEIVFLATGYRRFSWPVMVAAGAFDALVFFWTRIAWSSGYLVLNNGVPTFKLAPAVVLGFLVIEMISGGLAGRLAKAIGDALVPTGVLDGFAIAAHRKQEI